MIQEKPIASYPPVNDAASSATCSADQLPCNGRAKDTPDVLPVLRTKDERRKFYDKIAPCYDVLAERSEQPIRETALDMLSPAPGERILEIGFGTGHLLSRIAESVGEEGRVYGIDISEKMLRMTELVLEAKKVESRVELHRGDAASLPFDDGTMDAVILCFTLELFDTQEIPQVLAECRRVLHRDGRIVVAALSKEGKPQFLAKTFEWTHRHFPNLMDCRPIHVQRAIEDAGFTVEADRLDDTWMPVEILIGHKETSEGQECAQQKAMQRATVEDSSEGERRCTADENLTREQVHELRNRLYASSLAFRAICRMIDDGKTNAARAAAQTMLDTLNEELHDSHQCALDQSGHGDNGDLLHILLVEDDSMEAQLLSDYLAEQGYKVTRAEDGIAALSRLKNDPLPDIVLLDMNMPRLDGPKTITSIRTNDRLKNLTLVAISGTDATTSDMQKARRSVNFWITKPANPERINAAILELAATG